MMAKIDAYQLKVTYGDDVIATLALDNATNLLKLSYAPQWQQQGFAISPHLPLNNQHTPEVAYNYLDNSLPDPLKSTGSRYSLYQGIDA
ncbi:HipA-like protein [Rheinheimera pacifica]|uniref:HipA N-terminal domain-containing protein n=1 Tax=Rheinheimera pacifica TaxID=173990 RepID=UPI0021696A4B|nr:HipA N-terminal domain-containing protein [Rheinheimera pacifica]MCS4308277.1 HipA-like protein [Rheinheimera pacifica]